ncbi:hypothetical protein BDB01DRAFT_840856 [Pilobolus umbonatus]|nr:hypothetical protein BDB01DRAFT_840856 [Pilobolus umbonatus]
MHTEPNQKKKVQLITSASICHIDESSLFGNKSISDTLGKLYKENYPDFTYSSVQLEEIFNTDNAILLKSTLGGIENTEYEHPVEIVKEKKIESALVQLKTLFNSIKKTTAKEDLLWNMKMALLVDTARREGCSYIFMADCATRQAIKMIALTSKGRGYSLPLDIGVENDISFPGICVMRPMKDMLAKEIGFYNHFADISNLVIPTTNFNTMAPTKNSIDRLTEEFIVTLEKDFPATVSTVCRTVTKLTPSADMNNARSCAICMM